MNEMTILEMQAKMGSGEAPDGTRRDDISTYILVWEGYVCLFRGKTHLPKRLLRV